MYTFKSKEIFHELAVAFIHNAPQTNTMVNMAPWVFVTLLDEAELEARATSYSN